MHPWRAFLFSMFLAAACAPPLPPSEGDEWGENDGPVAQNPFPETLPPGVPVGPGGGGSPSGLVATDAGLMLAIDVGGVRSWSSTASDWAAETLPSGTRSSDSITAIATRGGVTFAATKDGRIYRTSAPGGWTVIYEYVNASDSKPQAISSLYIDPRTGRDILYAGTGSIDMRRDKAIDQHPKKAGNGRIVRLDNASSGSRFAAVVYPLPNAGLDQQNILDFELVRDPRTKTDFLFVATDLGLYWADWTQGENSGVPSWNKDELLIASSGVRANGNTRIIERAGPKSDPRLVLTVDYDFNHTDPEVCGTETQWNGQVLTRRLQDPEWALGTGFDPCDNAQIRPRRTWQVAVDSTNRNSLFACEAKWSGALYESKNGGVAWQRVFDKQKGTSSPFFAGNVFQCRYIALTTTDIFVAGQNLGGVWRISRSNSSDFEYLIGDKTGSDAWVGRGASNFTLVTKVAFSGSKLLATLYDYALMIGGGTATSPEWTAVTAESNSLHGVGTAIAVDPGNRSRVFYSSYYREPGPGPIAVIRGSLDDGLSWTMVASPSTPGLQDMEQVTSLLLRRDAANAAWLFAVVGLKEGQTPTKALFRTKLGTALDNLGWERVDVGVSDENVFAVAGHPASDSLLAATSAGVSEATLGDTLSWTPIGALASWSNAQMFASSATQAFLLVIDSSNKNQGRDRLVSVDRARKSWEFLKDTSSNTFDLTGSGPADLTYRGQRLLVSSQRDGISVYAYDAQSTGWTRSNLAGLPTQDIRTVAFRGRDIYVGTGGYGLYRFPDAL